jgi:hypothetical protein
MAERNAARVFPEPVGARMSVDSPRTIAGHPRAWARVGFPNVARKYARVGSAKDLRTSGTDRA